jgi:hypothetical protein
MHRVVGVRFLKKCTFEGMVAKVKDFRLFLSIVLNFLFFNMIVTPWSMGDDTVQEVLEDRRKFIDAYDEINRFNPLSQSKDQDRGMDSGAVNFSQANSASMAHFEEILNSRFYKVYFEYVTDPEVKRGVQELINHPRQKEFIYTQLGFLVFFLLFRTWRMGRVKTFFGRVFYQFWTSLFFIGLSGIVIPMIFFGSTYWGLIQRAWIKIGESF